MVAARSVGDDAFGVEKYQPLRNQTMGSCRGPVDKLRVTGAICQLEGVRSGAPKKRFCQLGCVNWGGLQCQLGSCKVRQGESILCAAQVGIDHVSMGEHEHPRASCAALHR